MHTKKAYPPHVFVDSVKTIYVVVFSFFPIQGVISFALFNDSN